MPHVMGFLTDAANNSQMSFQTMTWRTALGKNRRAESLHDHLFRIFYDEEVERRLEGVDPQEREVIRSQIGPADE